MTADSQTAEILVVGATGLLGTAIARLLRAEGKPVHAIVRAGADPAKRSALLDAGVDAIAADLRDRASLDSACQKVTAVVSTASATLSRKDGDSLESVDRDGQLALVEAAERAGVERFVYISLPPNGIRFTLHQIKLQIEDRLRDSAMSFTILQPAHFMEVWLSPALGFAPLNGSARVYGDGTKAMNWVSFRDVARLAARAACDPELARKTIPIGGPDEMTPLDVLRLLEERGAGACAIEYVPEAALEAQRAAAANAGSTLEEAYAALMLTQARGQRVDAVEAQRWLRGPLRSIKDYAIELEELARNQ
jgi:NADH dehydrogenase